MQYFRHVKRYARPYKKQLVIGPVFKLAEAVLELTMPVFMAKIIDIGVAQNNISYIFKTGGVMVLVALTGLVCALICQYSASVASQGFGTALRSGMFAQINQMRMEEIDRFGTDTLSTRLNNDVTQLQAAVAMIIRLLIRAPFISIGCIAAAISIHLKLSAVIAVTVASFVLVLCMIMYLTSPLYTKVQESLDQLSLKIRESLLGVRVIRAFVRSEDDRELAFKVIDLTAENTKKVYRISSLLNPLTSCLMNGAVIAILWYGGGYVNQGALSTGEVVAFINYVSQVLVALTVVANLVVLFTKSYASLKRVDEVMAAKTEESGTANDCAAKTEEILSLEGVTFSYTTDGDPELSNISLAVKSGERIGITGITGSGKTTLISLITGLYPVQEGRLLVLAKKPGCGDIELFRSEIAVAEQKPALFAGTIYDNIRYGNPKASAEEIYEAARMAQAETFILQKQDGYHTKIGRGGRGLSGGQRQRLVIARALVRRPKLLILDDSLSALDAGTSSRVLEELMKLKETTVIIISQSISVMKKCDKILVLKDGEQEGYGSHQELLMHCQEYRELAAFGAEGEGGANA